MIRSEAAQPPEPGPRSSLNLSLNRNPPSRQRQAGALDVKSALKDLFGETFEEVPVKAAAEGEKITCPARETLPEREEPAGLGGRVVLQGSLAREAGAPGHTQLSGEPEGRARRIREGHGAVRVSAG